MIQKLSFQKITKKIDRNLKCKITTLPGSNFILFTKKFIQRQKCSKTEILKKSYK